MEESYKPQVVAIGGPTASGKTTLSIAIARAFGGEILSADSMQIYRGLNVGTAKATPEERALIPHHLLDICEPNEAFNVADYVALAGRTIRELTVKKKLPVVVGGTGLYISSLIEGVTFAKQKNDPIVRRQLQNRLEIEGVMEMHRELQLIDPEAAASIHPNNTGRVLRALELYQLTGKTMTQQKAESYPEEKPYRVLLLCTGGGDRKLLYSRINQRVDAMLSNGLLCEAECVYKNRRTYTTAAQAIGYKEFFPYFDGIASLSDCIQKLKQASRNYAKRQLTWFRRMPDVHWLDMTDSDAISKAMDLVRKFMDE